jgi:hypothetical protein
MATAANTRRAHQRVSLPEPRVLRTNTTNQRLTAQQLSVHSCTHKQKQATVRALSRQNRHWEVSAPLPSDYGPTQRSSQPVDDNAQGQQQGQPIKHASGREPSLASLNIYCGSHKHFSSLRPCLDTQIHPQILLCKKKILYHIKMSAHIWSTKCR